MNEQSRHSSPYSQDEIRRYLEGDMSLPEMHALEKAALSDPFLADAVEGFRSADHDTAAVHLRDINNVIRNDKAEASIASAGRAASSWVKIAAVAILIIGAGTTAWFMSRPAEQKNISQAEMPEQTPAPAVPGIRKTDTVKNDLAISKRRTASHSQRSFQEKKPDTTVTAASLSAPGAARSRLSVQGPGSVPANTAQHYLAGKIVDVNNKPVPGASVITSSGHGTTADYNGDFRLQVADSVKTMQVVALGFEGKKIPASKDSAARIVLSPSNFSLSEVVITGYSAKRKTVETGSMSVPRASSADILPVNGWPAFQSYLEDKLAAYLHTAPDSVTATIDAELQCNKKGKVKKATILKSSFYLPGYIFTKACRSGPEWTLPDGKPSSGKHQVHIILIASPVKEIP